MLGEAQNRRALEKHVTRPISAGPPITPQLPAPPARGSHPDPHLCASLSFSPCFALFRISDAREGAWAQMQVFEA